MSVEQAMDKEPGWSGCAVEGRRADCDQQDAFGERPSTPPCRRQGARRLLVHVIVLETLLGGVLATDMPKAATTRD